MAQTQSMVSERDCWRQKANCRFVDRQKFMQLLVSRRHLERADDLRASLRGLLDRKSGVRFMIEEENL